MERSTKHGQARRGKLTGERRIWGLMKDRCGNPRSQDYAYYGGRGIQVCDRWRNSYEAFFADMGQRPFIGATLDRIDTNGHYEPSNCRWASRRTQSNNRRGNTSVMFGGERMTVADVAEITRLDYAALLRRITKEGQSADAAVHALRHGRKLKKPQ